ncbi:unnamed protein product [Polarella glacialis]|uniref:histidine kinase n=4 Tax=Polarella glacialis TaxID=89957 RepID=A0A813GI13_POLGL|nr:unnamed protein product [Polarella glacialis]
MHHVDAGDAGHGPSQEKETELDFIMKTVRQWNDFTSVVTVVICVLALAFSKIAPRWRVTDEELGEISWAFLSGLCISGTACLFELALVLAAKKKQELDLGSLGDACLMVFVYSALAVSYCFMSTDQFDLVHTDPLAFGGSRPVYTMRYIEWSICVPLLMCLSGSYRKEQLDFLGSENQLPAAQKDLCTGVSAEVPDTMEESDAQVLLFKPMCYVADNLMAMPLASSARLTSIYIFASWLALVVEDDFTRWILVFVSFIDYVVASAEQVAHCCVMRQHHVHPRRIRLLMIQVPMFGFYGLIYFAALLGLISATVEQNMYTFSDMGAKVMHSMILVSVRLQEDLHSMAYLRDTATTVAADLRRMIRQANAPIFCLNRSLEVVTWNLKMTELTSVTSEVAMGRRFHELLAQSPESRWHKMAHEVLENVMSDNQGDTLEIHFSRADGCMEREGSEAIMVLSATPQKSRSGEVCGVLCIGQDVTEQTRRTREAESLAARLATLIDTANAPIFAVDLDLRITEWNRWLVGKSGMSKSDALGKKILTLVSEDSRKAVDEVVALACQGKDSHIFEIGLLTGGKIVYLLINATPGVDANSTINGAICVGQEITHLKDMEEQKSAMMAMVSHELKSPLHGIIGLSHSLLEDEPTDSRLKKPLMMIHSCSRRLLDLVSNIMDASILVQDKKMRMSNDPVQIASIIEEVVLLCQQSVDQRGKSTIKKGVKLVNAVKEPLPLIAADAYRLTQLIYNLVSNALKFTHQGSVTVSATADDIEQMVIIDVTDTGIGIAPENLDRIFQPFDQEDTSESRHYEGLGLGLAISREVVLKHGGNLTVKSTQGRGSTFRTTLPYKMRTGEEGEDIVEQPRTYSTSSLHGKLKKPVEDRRFFSLEPTAETPPNGETISTKTNPVKVKSRKTRATPGTPPLSTSETLKGPVRTSSDEPRALPLVLSVDDSEVNQEVVQGLLSTKYQVVTAMNGTEALNFIRCNAPPALILLDVMMPGISGPDVLKQLRRSHSAQSLPVIMVSAMSDDDCVGKCFKQGCNDYITKPFTAVALLARVKLHLELSFTCQQKMTNGHRTPSGGSLHAIQDLRPSRGVSVSLLEGVPQLSCLASEMPQRRRAPLQRKQQRRTCSANWSKPTKGMPQSER